MDEIIDQWKLEDFTFKQKPQTYQIICHFKNPLQIRRRQATLLKQTIQRLQKQNPWPIGRLKAEFQSSILHEIKLTDILHFKVDTEKRIPSTPSRFLYQIRKERSLTQAGLAQCLSNLPNQQKFSASCISNYEKGIRQPKPSFLAQLSKALSHEIIIRKGGAIILRDEETYPQR